MAAIRAMGDSPNRTATAITFEIIAKERYALQKKTLGAQTLYKARWTLETSVMAHLGRRPITHVTAEEVLNALKRIEGQVLRESAHRTRQRISQIFRHAIATNRTRHDVTRALLGALAPVVTQHRAAITDPNEFYGCRSSPRFGEGHRNLIDCTDVRAMAWAARQAAQWAPRDPTDA